MMSRALPALPDMESTALSDIEIYMPSNKWADGMNSLMVNIQFHDCVMAVGSKVSSNPRKYTAIRNMFAAHSSVIRSMVLNAQFNNKKRENENIGAKQNNKSGVEEILSLDENEEKQKRTDNPAPLPPATDEWAHFYFDFITPEIFELIRYYVYGMNSKITFTKSNVHLLGCAANKWGFEELEERCCYYLNNVITRSNFWYNAVMCEKCEWFSATASVLAPKLEELLGDPVDGKQHAEAMMNSDWLYCIKPDLFASFVASNQRVQLDEGDMLKLCVQYCKQHVALQGSNKKWTEIFEDYLLKHVRFSLISKKPLKLLLFGHGSDFKSNKVVFESIMESYFSVDEDNGKESGMNDVSMTGAANSSQDKPKLAPTFPRGYMQIRYTVDRSVGVPEGTSSDQLTFTRLSDENTDNGVCSGVAQSPWIEIDLLSLKYVDWLLWKTPGVNLMTQNKYRSLDGVIIEAVLSEGSAPVALFQIKSKEVDRIQYIHIGKWITKLRFVRYSDISECVALGHLSILYLPE